MAKKFVRKDTDIRWIQEIRDFTNDIGDILVKDDRYAYVRTFGEYKPISFPMVWDYKGIPKNEITKSDYFVDKDGVHKLDKKDTTSNQYDLIKDNIDETRTIKDSNGNIINKLSYHQDTNYLNLIGNIINHYYSLMLDQYGYYVQSQYNGSDINLTRYYNQTNNADELSANYTNFNTNYMYNISKSGLYSTLNTKDNNYKNIITNVNLTPSNSDINIANSDGANGYNSNYYLHIDFNNVYIELTLNDNNIIIMVKPNDIHITFMRNSIVLYEFGIKNGLFYTDGEPDTINSLKNYYDTLLGVTAKYNDALSKISNLQSQINSLESRLTALENK